MFGFLKRAAPMRALGLVVAVATAAALGSALAATPTAPFQPGDSIPGQQVQVRASGRSSTTRVPAQERGRNAQSVTINVTYDANFNANPQAKAAFQAAVNIWSAQLTGSVPITVNAQFSVLSPGVLGSAGASRYFRNFTGAVPGTYYPVTLASEIAGRDLNNGTPMIDASFSSASDINWYFGTDGNTPRGQSDFESVVLHELGHGLGFVGGGEYDGVTPTVGLNGAPMIYDRFVADGSGNVPYQVSNAVQLLSILQGNNLFWTGAQGIAQAGGSKPKLYAPAVWEEGSSYSHLDEATYPAGNPNELMTPALDDGESVHDPGPIVRGMFADMGWTIAGGSSPTATPTATATATPTPVPCATPASKTLVPAPTALARRTYIGAILRNACS